MVRRCLLAAFVLLGVIAAVPARADGMRCSGDPHHVRRIDIEVDGTPTWGLYALPAGRPKGLVAFFHGYGHTPESWRWHIERTAAELGVIAVSMNYRGNREPEDPDGVRGWRVREGAEDTNQVVAAFQAACPLRVTVAYGISMGGNAAGIAVADSDLYDWLIAVEGAHNVTETYLEARSVAVSGNDYAEGAYRDIEAGFGGPIEEHPEVYADATNVARAGDIASHVKGVVLVHGVMDGLVPYNQSREMQAALRALGEPVDFSSVVLRGEAETGTVPENYVTPLGENGYQSPFAGHGSEASCTHRVTVEGFERLAELLRTNKVENREAVVDAEGQSPSICKPNRST